MWDIKKLKNHLACVTIIAKKSPGKKKMYFSCHCPGENTYVIEKENCRLSS